MAETNPLEGLYGDKSAYDRERLAQSLSGVLGVDKTTGEPIFQHGWDALDGKGKTTAYLLYRVAADALDELREEQRGLSLEEISGGVGLAKKTISSYLTRLEFIENSPEAGGHHIPDHGIGKAIQLLEAKKE